MPFLGSNLRSQLSWPLWSYKHPPVSLHNFEQSRSQYPFGSGGNREMTGSLVYISAILSGYAILKATEYFWCPTVSQKQRCVTPGHLLSVTRVTGRTKELILLGSHLWIRLRLRHFHFCRLLHVVPSESCLLVVSKIPRLVPPLLDPAVPGLLIFAEWSGNPPLKVNRRPTPMII